MEIFIFLVAIGIALYALDALFEWGVVALILIGYGLFKISGTRDPRPHVRIR